MEFSLIMNITVGITSSRVVWILFPILKFLAFLANIPPVSFSGMPMWQAFTAEYISYLICPFLSIDVGCLELALNGLYLIPLKQL